MGEQTFIEAESDESQKTDNQSAQNVTRSPWVCLTTPRKADQEEHNASEVEDESDPIELHKLLLDGLAVDVQLIVLWWMVEELVEHESYGITDNADIIRPSPACRSIVDKCAADRWAKDGEWQSRQEDDGDRRRTKLVWHEFTDDDAEGQLTSSCNTNHGLRRDKSTDALGGSSDNDTDEGQNLTCLDTPFATEDVRQTTEEEETDRGPKCPTSSDPRDVNGRTDVRIDQSKSVCGEHPSEVGTIVGETRSLGRISICEQLDRRDSAYNEGENEVWRDIVARWPIEIVSRSSPTLLWQHRQYSAAACCNYRSSLNVTYISSRSPPTAWASIKSTVPSWWTRLTT